MTLANSTRCVALCQLTWIHPIDIHQAAAHGVLMPTANSPYDTTEQDGDRCCRCPEAATREWRDRLYCSDHLDEAQYLAGRLTDPTFPSYIDEPADSDRPTIRSPEVAA